MPNRQYFETSITRVLKYLIKFYYHNCIRIIPEKEKMNKFYNPNNQYHDSQLNILQKFFDFFLVTHHEIQHKR